jgi:hypothetical protein
MLDLREDGMTKNQLKSRSLTIWRTLSVVLVAGILVASGCAAPEKAPEEPSEPVAAETPAAGAETEVEMVEYLFVQHAEGAKLEAGVLTLEGVGHDILYFSDRPHRIVGRETLAEFLAAWTEGEESFEEIPPNAVLTTKQGDELRNLTVVLMNPVFSDGTLAYDVEVLDGPETGSGGFAALFIDVIGAPMIGPTSVRGVARRTARRTTRRVNRRDEYMEEAGDDYGDDYYGGGGTVEEQLRELDDLLDQGLITQEDYDREKDEILAGV